MRRITSLAAATLFTSFTLAAQAPATPPGITRMPLFDNASATVTRLQFMPGAREMPHTHPFPLLVIQLSAGDLELLKGSATAKSTRPVGAIEYIERETPHAVSNAGTRPFELLAVAIKPDRARGGTAPPMPRPQGITSTDIFDASDAAVRRVEFAPGAREAVHTHPYDFVLVPAANGRIEVHLAGKDTTKDYAPGEAVFIARNTPHAVANVGRERFTLLGVTIK